MTTASVEDRNQRGQTGNPWELVRVFTRRELTAQYRSTWLGQIWSLLNPLAFMVIYTVVFSMIIKVQVPAGNPSGLNIFPLWLLAGLVPWTFFATAITLVMMCMLTNQGLLTKVYFKRWTLPVSSTLAALYTFVIEIVLLTLALSIAGGKPWKYLVLVVFFMVCLALFSCGFGVALSISQVYFRDTQYLVGIALQAWFFLTAIVYPPSLVASTFAGDPESTLARVMTGLFAINPMEQFVLVFRALLYDNRLPDMPETIGCLAWTLVAAAAGTLVYRRFAAGLVEAL